MLKIAILPLISEASASKVEIFWAMHIQANSLHILEITISSNVMAL